MLYHVPPPSSVVKYVCDWTSLATPGEQKEKKKQSIHWALSPNPGRQKQTYACHPERSSSSHPSRVHGQLKIPKPNRTRVFPVRGTQDATSTLHLLLRLPTANPVPTSKPKQQRVSPSRCENHNKGIVLSKPTASSFIFPPWGCALLRRATGNCGGNNENITVASQHLLEVANCEGSNSR